MHCVFGKYKILSHTGYGTHAHRRPAGGTIFVLPRQRSGRNSARKRKNPAPGTKKTVPGTLLGFGAIFCGAGPCDLGGLRGPDLPNASSLGPLRGHPAYLGGGAASAHRPHCMDSRSASGRCPREREKRAGWVWNFRGPEIVDFGGLGGPGATGTPLDRPGPPRTSICTKNQPRRPILRPFRV